VITRTTASTAAVFLLIFIKVKIPFLTERKVSP